MECQELEIPAPPQFLSGSSLVQRLVQEHRNSIENSSSLMEKANRVVAAFDDAETSEVRDECPEEVLLLMVVAV
jgi:hypothetical protein